MERVFAVPPQQLNGDQESIRKSETRCTFDAIRALFARSSSATPHRGSKLAESWIGHVGASLIRLPIDLADDFVAVVV